MADYYLSDNEGSEDERDATEEEEVHFWRNIMISFLLDHPGVEIV